MWIREVHLNRSLLGFFDSSFEQIKTKGAEQILACTRMSSSVFDVLFTLLEPSLIRTSWRVAVSPKCRLFLTIVYLSQEVSRQYLSMTFKLGVSTVREIALETCDAIWAQLSAVYIAPPNKEEWKKIANDFYIMWDLPNCIGAIDGKHINLTCPSHSGSQFYNYKGSYSIVLLAICDANYTFTAIDIGAYGSQSDRGVLAASAFGKAMLNGDLAALDLPEDSNLIRSTLLFPHYFVGDAAFPLRRNIMRPFPGHSLQEKKEHFNKRLSRARNTIENAFGILTARWRILRQAMNMSPDSATKIVQAAVVLHNFVKLHDDKQTYLTSDVIDHEVDGVLLEGLWRQQLVPLPQARQKFGSKNASEELSK